MMISTTGIYKITNIKNEKVYIGSSKNISQRWIQHLNLLKRNKHHSAHLQYAWNLYGEDCFEFSTIEEVYEIDKLFEREQFFIDQYKSCNENHGYNICGVAGKLSDFNNNNVKYRKINDEYKSELYKREYEFVENEETQPFISSRPDNIDDVFTLLIKGLFNFYHLGLIDSDKGFEIKLYTKHKNINMHNFQDVSYDKLNDIIDSNYFEMLKVDDYRYGYFLNIYRDKLVRYQFDYDSETKFCKLLTQTQYEIDEITLSYIG